MTGRRGEVVGIGTLQPGTVVAFDADRGTGVVEGPDGSRYPFHCTRITDGSRSVTPGARVTFCVGPGLLGRWEATQVAKPPTA